MRSGRKPSTTSKVLRRLSASAAAGHGSGRTTGWRIPARAPCRPRGAPFGIGLHAVDDLQHARIEILHADAQAVESMPAQHRSCSRRGVARIDFDGQVRARRRRCSAAACRRAGGPARRPAGRWACRHPGAVRPSVSCARCQALAIQRELAQQRVDIGRRPARGCARCARCSRRRCTATGRTGCAHTAAARGWRSQLRQRGRAMPVAAPCGAAPQCITAG